MDGNAKGKDSQETVIMNIVEVTEIPKKEDIQDVPLDDLAAIYKVCSEMRKVCDSENGIGLSAVQVGIPWKLFVMKMAQDCLFGPKDSYGYFVNCDYKSSSKADKIASIEGCLSLKSDNASLRHFQVERFTDVLINGKRLLDDSSLSLVEIENLSVDVSNQSVVMQHEIDHHFGVLISDIGKEIFLWK